jgi:hypothetical protein
VLIYIYTTDFLVYANITNINRRDHSACFITSTRKLREVPVPDLNMFVIQVSKNIAQVQIRKCRAVTTTFWDWARAAQIGKIIWSFLGKLEKPTLT